LHLRLHWAVGLLDGSRLPYRDFDWEYPPGALPLVVAPHLVSGFHAYVLLSAALMLAFDGLTFRRLRRLDRELHGHRGWLLWLVAVPALGPVSLLRLDLAAAAFAACGAAALVTGGKGTRAGLLGGLGAAIKLWPALLLLTVADSRQRLAMTRTFVAVIACTYALGTLVGGSLTWPASMVRFHSGRNLQIESLAALPVLVARAAGDTNVQVIYDKSFNVVGTSTNTLLLTSKILSLVVLAGMICLVSYVARRAGTPAAIDTLAASMLALLCCTPVFSPQYMIWPIALVAVGSLRGGRGTTRLIIALTTTALLTQAIYPTFYSKVLDGGWPGVLLLAARDVAILMTTGIAALHARASWIHEHGRREPRLAGMGR
jgi:hypothetical protein